MVDTNLERAALAAIAAQPEKRVLPLTYENKCYYIKRRLANGRNAFAKSGTDTSFYREAYKILAVNARIPLAPHIEILHDDFFLMNASGMPLQSVAAALPAEEAVSVYYNAGKALAELHSRNLWHGRPALRDITWDKKTGKITFLDWENKVPFIKTDYRITDLFLLLHSCFREEWPTEDLIDATVEGYKSVASEARRFIEVRSFINEHRRFFSICRSLSAFHWIDVVSVTMTAAYICKITAERQTEPL